MKGTLKELLEKAGVVFPRTSRGDIVHPKRMWESMIIRDSNNEILYITGYQRWFPAILAGCTVFGILLVGWMIACLITGYIYKKGMVNLDADRCLKDSRDKKRRVRMGVSPNVDSPVTIGMVTPVILFPLDNEKYSASEKGIISHELHHIIKMDSLFRFLSFVIIAMEWYNPLAYYLFKENIAVSEMLCDEAAVESMSKEEKLDYMRCIITAAEKYRNAKKVIMTLGATKGLTMERLTRIMGKNEKKTWKKGLAAGIMILCFVFSSIPALAYKEPLGLEIVDADAIDLWKRADLTMAVHEENLETNYIKEMDFSQSDGVLVNETGEISPYDENIRNVNQKQAPCAHKYESTAYVYHDKSGDGSCIVITYSAQKCSKCGYVNVGSEISRIIYKVCPHE
ncbi:MAG: M56 family metallopeptidase [Lachnospiraceae bacterium]|nr:M56 family metallopeptidase [Lachnospiraceae bacterium]